VIDRVLGDAAKVMVNLFGRETPATVPLSTLGAL